MLKLLRLAQKLPLPTARLFQHTRSLIAFTPGRFIGPQWAFPPSRGAVEPNRHQIEINKSPLNWTKKDADIFRYSLHQMAFRATKFIILSKPRSVP